MSTISAEIDSVAGACVYPKFDYAFSYRLCITEVAVLKLAEPAGNTRLGNFVAKS
jgi:hypothetical protein